MPISDTATNATQSNPFAALAASQTNPSMNAPGLSFQSINTNPMNVSASQANPQGVLDVLSQHGPQSLTSTLMPLYQQLFGAQSGALAQNRDMQAQTGRANAQSDAMRRGLTGSSIESAGMQGAQQSADMGYNQAYSQLLSNIVGQYTGAAQTDIGSQQNYYQTIAQALGQTYASNTQQDQFNRQLAANIQAANENADATKTAGMWGGIGSALGGFARFSDARLKKNIRLAGEKMGMPLYRFEYRQDKGIKLPEGEQVSFMAHDVYDKYPDCVGVRDGYLYIDSDKLASRGVA